MIVVNAIPPGHYGLPFVDLLDDDQLLDFMNLAKHPHPSVEILSHIREGIRMASDYPITRTVQLDCPVTTIQARRSIWLSYHTMGRWADACGELSVIEHDGRHFAPVDEQLATIVARVASEPALQLR